MEIKTGDIVWLKSGGPAMTVQGRDMGGMYKCTYFDKDNNRGGGSFAAEVLTTNEPNNKPKPTVRNISNMW